MAQHRRHAYIRPREDPGDIADTSYPTFIRDVGALAMGSSMYDAGCRRRPE